MCESRDAVKKRLAVQEKEETFVEELELFLRVDSNEAMTLLINDSDPIYFFVPRTKLARSDFEQVFSRVTQG